MAKRSLPLGVELEVLVELNKFLPYRIHKLAAGVSSPRSFTLDSGEVIRGREWRVLLVLAAFGPLSIKDVADRVVMDSATATRAVQDLLALGMVATRAHTSDRRKQVVTLTAKGAAAHDYIAPQRIAFADEVLSALAPYEQEMLFALIDRLEAQLAEMVRKDDDPFAHD